MQPPAGSQVSRVPAQRTPQEDLAPPPAPPAPMPPRRRLRTVLTVAGVVLSVLCLSGAVTVYILYSRASAPDRSAPDVVVDNYLRAFLVDRNDARADLFTCDQESDGVAELRALRTDLETREKRFGVNFSVKWGGLTVQENGKQAEVVADLTISAFVEGISQSDRQSWQFTIREEDDWRVCEAAKIG
ncbi:hypothetical protein ACIBJE_22115 [Micromonospora sp. NPDC050187]|uniref:hypothetical protein n=1 Tax=Micromonospora sp. NPDC050187 TaxID=3364277 RepID=UPI0037B595FE